jgi:NAD(P)-dependent dehydrogenase (short-subunit alcohol dehydrogenase family)
MGRLDGCRALVVGASGGLGRAIASRLDAEGARVAVAARRVDLLAQLRDEAGGRPVVVACDVRDPEACARAVDEAVDRLGGLDALVYAPGVAVIAELSRANAVHWHEVLSTNVVGASLVTAAAVPHLEASAGVAVYLSSVSAHLTPPWRGMGLYIASKVALEKCVEVWKLEHPSVRFTTIVAGSTAGGEFFPHAHKPFPDDLAPWGARTGSLHATSSYSWIRPPRTSRRRTCSDDPAALLGGSARCSGGRNPRERCGRWVL